VVHEPSHDPPVRSAALLHRAANPGAHKRAHVPAEAL